MVLFKKIKNFNNYWIDFSGNIYSESSNKILKPRSNGNGYFSFQLFKDGTLYTKLLHRLIAETFIPNLKNHPMVDHIDQNKLNNSINNLRWVTNQLNQHNTKRNNIDLNIYKNSLNNKENYRVLFNFKKFKIKGRTFKNLNDAKLFRDLIQKQINDNKIDPIFIELFKNENKYISKTINNKYILAIHSKKFYKTFETLEEAKNKRYEFLQKKYSLN